jgi:hypothetical protein
MDPHRLLRLPYTHLPESKQQQKTQMILIKPSDVKAAMKLSSPEKS